MSATLYTARHVVTRADPRGSDVLRDGAVLVEGGIIREVGPADALRSRFPDVPTAGGSDRMIIPGLINAHHHGNAVSPIHVGVADGPLERWLLQRMGEKALSTYESAAVAAIKMLRSGTTTVMLNHVPRGASTIDQAAREMIRGFNDVGLRVCYSLSLRLQNRLVYQDDDTTLAALPRELAAEIRPLLETSALSLDEYFTFYDRLASDLSGVDRSAIKFAISPANLIWCADEQLQALKHFADRMGYPIHMHLLETIYQQRYAERTYGASAVAHLREIGLLDSRLSLAHAIWLMPDDIRMIIESGAQVCHNPSSNLRLRSGIAPITELTKGGAVVAIGTDAMTLNDDDDLLQEMRLVHWLHRRPGLATPVISSDEVLAMATTNAARVVGSADEIGCLLPGRRADLVVLRLDRIAWSGLDETTGPVAALLRVATRDDVETVVVEGRRLLDAGRVLAVDEGLLYARLRTDIRRSPTLDEMHRSEVVRSLLPYVDSFYSETH